MRIGQCVLRSIEDKVIIVAIVAALLKVLPIRRRYRPEEREQK